MMADLIKNEDGVVNLYNYKSIELLMLTGNMGIAEKDKMDIYFKYLKSKTEDSDLTALLDNFNVYLVQSYNVFKEDHKVLSYAFNLSHLSSILKLIKKDWTKEECLDSEKDLEINIYEFKDLGGTSFSEESLVLKEEIKNGYFIINF